MKVATTKRKREIRKTSKLRRGGNERVNFQAPNGQSFSAYKNAKNMYDRKTDHPDSGTEKIPDVKKDIDGDVYFYENDVFDNVRPKLKEFNMHDYDTYGFRVGDRVGIDDFHKGKLKNLEENQKRQIENQVNKYENILKNGLAQAKTRDEMAYIVGETIKKFVNDIYDISETMASGAAVYYVAAVPNVEWMKRLKTTLLTAVTVYFKPYIKEGIKIVADIIAQLLRTEQGTNVLVLLIATFLVYCLYRWIYGKSDPPARVQNNNGNNGDGGDDGDDNNGGRGRRVAHANNLEQEYMESMIELSRYVRQNANANIHLPQVLPQIEQQPVPDIRGPILPQIEQQPPVLRRQPSRSRARPRSNSRARAPARGRELPRIELEEPLPPLGPGANNFANNAARASRAR